MNAQPTLPLFREKRPRARPKSQSLEDYGTVREWTRPLTGRERQTYLTPRPSGTTYPSFYEMRTRKWGFLERRYVHGENIMHIRLFRRYEAR